MIIKWDIPKEVTYAKELKKHSEEFIKAIHITSSLEEAETIINIPRKGPENTYAFIWTTDMNYFNKIRKTMLKDPDNWLITDIAYRIVNAKTKEYEITGVMIRCPKRSIYFKAQSMRYTMSEEEKERRSRTLKNYREKMKKI